MGQPGLIRASRPPSSFNTVSDYWGCPKCGNLTLRFEDKNGRVNVATCDYDKCDYFDEGVPE